MLLLKCAEVDFAIDYLLHSKSTIHRLYSVCKNKYKVHTIMFYCTYVELILKFRSKERLEDRGKKPYDVDRNKKRSALPKKEQRYTANKNSEK